MPWDRRQRWPRSWTLFFPGSLTSASSPNEVILGSLPLATNSEGTTLSFWYSVLTPTYASHDIIGTNGTSDFYISFTGSTNNTNKVLVSHLNSANTDAASLFFTAPATIAWQKITYEFDTDHAAFYHGPTLQSCQQITGLRAFSSISSFELNYNRNFSGRLSDLAIFDESHDSDRVARDYPWNIRTGTRGIELEALYYWPFDENPRPVSASNSLYLNELMQGNNATITGGSIKLVSSGHPLHPRYSVILLAPTTSPTSKFHIPTIPDSYHQVVNVTQINIHRESASLFRPLSIGRMTFVVDDNLNKYRTSVDSWIRPNRAVVCRVEYCGSEHLLFAGEVSKVVDQWQPYAGFGEAGYIKKTVYCDDSLKSLMTTYRYDVTSVNGNYQQFVDGTFLYDVPDFTIDFPVLRTPKSTVVKAGYVFGTGEDEPRIYGFEKYESTLAVAQKGIQFTNMVAWVGPDPNTGVPNALTVQPFSYAEFGTAVATISEFKSFASELSYATMANYVEIDVNPKNRILPGSAGGITNAIYVPASTQVHIDYDILDHQYGGGGPAPGDSWSARSLTVNSHWTTNASSDGLGVDRSSTTSFETAQTQYFKGGYFVKNTSPTNNMWLTKFVPPTYILTDESKQLVTRQNTVSQNSYGLHELSLRNIHHFKNATVAESKATYIMSRHHSPIPTVRAYVENYFGYCFKANAGDLVNIVNSATNNVNKFFVTSFEHDINIGAGVLVHGISFSCENHQLTGQGGGGPAPPPPPPPPSSLAGFGEWDAYASTGYGATPVSSHWARIMSLVTTSWYVDNTSELNTAAAAAIGGTVIYCRAGAYNGTINLNTNGTSAAPIVVRAESLGTWGSRNITWNAKVNAGGDFLKIGGIKYSWDPGSSNAFLVGGIHYEMLDCDVTNNVMPLTTSRIIRFEDTAHDAWIHHNYAANNKGFTFVIDPTSTSLCARRMIFEYNTSEAMTSLFVQWGQNTEDRYVVNSCTARYNRFSGHTQEAVEIKTSFNRVYRNYIYNCVNPTTLRIGEGNIVDNNYYKQNGRPIRVFDGMSTIVNNIFEGTTGEASVSLLEGSTLEQTDLSTPNNANHSRVQSCLIAHNLFYLCASRSIYMGRKQTGQEGRPEPYSSKNVWIFNNIFRLTQGKAIFMRTPDTIPTTSDSYDLTIDTYHKYLGTEIKNNNFYLTGTAVSGRSAGTGTIAWDDATYTGSTVITGTTSANPLLGPTYRITSGSPCANAGLAFNKNNWNTSSQYDWDGNPRLAGSAPDQGQYEIA